MNEERLRELYAHALRDVARARTNRDGCLTPEAMIAAAEGESPESERERALEHIASCDDCRREFALIELVASRRPKRRWNLTTIGALAAAVIVVAAVGTYARSAIRARAGERELVRSGARNQIVVIAPTSDERESEPRFIWHAVSGASFYDFELLRPDGAVAVVASTRDTLVSLAPSTSLRSGNYDWTVRARLADGSELRSPLTRVRLRAR